MERLTARALPVGLPMEKPKMTKIDKLRLEIQNLQENLDSINPDIPDKIHKAVTDRLNKRIANLKNQLEHEISAECARRYEQEVARFHASAMTEAFEKVGL